MLVRRVFRLTTYTASFKPYTYWSLVFSACAIAQHLSSIFIFLAIFVRLLGQTFDPRLLVVLSLAMFVTGCVVWELLDYSWGENNQRATDRRTCFFGLSLSLLTYRRTGAKTLKAAILVFLALMALSPILRTLTASTSSDSIWALSACLFLLNAALADYRSVRLSGQVREE